MIRIAAAALLLAFAGGPAFAHLDPAEHGSLAAGLSHPVTGLDHVLAMITVGIWAALIGGRARWMVPSAFVAAMLAGFAAALAGVPIPFVEPAVLASVIVLGLLAALALRVPAAAGMATVALFAAFHGHAHGGELGAAGSLPFAAGFAVSTALLHAVGIAISSLLVTLAGDERGRLACRIAGGVAAAGGLVLALA